MIIYVEDKGFVMDFDLSGAVLKYTQIPHEAQSFDTRQQAMFTAKTNNIDVDKVSMLSYNI